MLRRGRAAALLPYDPEADAVVLMEQFRLPALAAGIDPVMLEIPAGLCDPGETPSRRSCARPREEIGLDADRLERVGDFVLTPGGADELVRIFVGRCACARLPDREASSARAVSHPSTRISACG